MTATPNDIIGRAAELIAERGWYQGSLEGPDGGLCALGALSRAKGEMFGLLGQTADIQTKLAAAAAYAGAFNKLLNAINPGVRALPDVVPHLDEISIPQWNDDPTRTAEDVILALKTAANN